MLEQAVLVTGAGRRIGFHVAKRLHEDGYTVIAHYRTHTDEIEQLVDAGITVIQAALTSTDAILNFIDELIGKVRTVRAVIHNASSYAPTSENLEDAAAQFDMFYTVHMKAPYMINRALKAKLVGQDGQPADIIHITDINAENPTPRFDIYGTTKAGLHNLTLVTAKEFGPDIKVNAVAPGPVLFTPNHTEELKKTLLSETPLAKEGGAEPVYIAIKSLLSNPFITGASIPVDGGRRLSKR